MIPRRRKAGSFNVAPRYTPGSPALVDEITAQRVAEREKNFIEHALEGVWGEEQQKRAEEQGLDLISFEMVERPKGWEVYDLITGRQYWWPFVANCPDCKAKKVRCRRGNLESHQVKSGYQLYDCPNRSFAGHEIRTEELPS